VGVKINTSPRFWGSDDKKINHLKRKYNRFPIDKCKLKDFKPTSISGLKYWFDTSDLSTLFKDSALTIPAILDSDLIGGWKDKSGNLYHATQAVDGNKPVVKLSIKNGLPIIRFDGVNDFLDTSGAILTQPTTIIVVIKYISVSSVKGVWIGNTSGIGANDSLLYHDTAENATMFAGSERGIGNGIKLIGFNVVTGLFNTTSSNGWVNGQKDTGSGDVGTKSFGSIKIGNSSGLFTGAFNGDIGEILIYNANLSSIDRARVEGYLKAKWNI
jgi:hypothetical protein